MKRSLNSRFLLGGAALAVCSAVVTAQDAPESLLPPGFDNPAPAPAPTSAPAATAAPTPTPSSSGSSSGGSSTPGAPSAPSGPAAPGGGSDNLPTVTISGNIPTLAELEKLSTDELDELLGLRPKFDMPASARRSLSNIGILSAEEGGLPAGSLVNQPASLVRAALGGIKSPMVSRWGHIMLRRALASRLDAPGDMRAAEFAALRAAALNTMGEHAAARALVQDVDTRNFTDDLTSAALDAYIGTADIVGACPIIRLGQSERDDPQFTMLSSICAAYAGEGTRANRQLDRAMRREVAPQIDVLLAQRFAGAAGAGRRAVNIEWDGVSQLSPWRFALARAVGVEVPQGLLDDAEPYYAVAGATGAMMPLAARADFADTAAQRGVLSSAAMVDLYSQIYATEGVSGDPAERANLLRNAYVGETPAQRIAAITSLWGSVDTPDYGRMVLTGFAAARLMPSSDLSEQAPDLIASMLTAGLDRDAAQWAPIVDDGSEGWALLALSQAGEDTSVSAGDVSSFFGDDGSIEQRKSQFLLAGLAGLGRIDSDAVADLSGDLGVDLARETNWSRAISGAADVNNGALVALLAGLGMQGDSWEDMTARHLYHIVSALNRSGLSAEARMIAAEAVARG